MSVIGYYLNSYYTGLLIKYPIKEQVLDLAPYLTVSLLMGAAVFAVELIQFSSQWSLLAVQISAGIIVYIGLCRAFRLKAFLDNWQTLRDNSSWEDSRCHGFKGSSEMFDRHRT